MNSNIGDYGDKFYIILKGRVSVLISQISENHGNGKSSKSKLRQQNKQRSALMTPNNRVKKSRNDSEDNYKSSMRSIMTPPDANLLSSQVVLERVKPSNPSDIDSPKSKQTLIIFKPIEY